MRTERLLVSLKTYLGDAVMASPMLDALEREFEGITIQTSPLVESLLQDPIRSRQFLPFVKSRNPLVTLRSALELRKHRFGAVVLVNRSFRAALVARLAGIPIRVGHAQEGRGALLTRAVAYDPDRFEAETCLDLARALGCEGEAKPHLIVSTAERNDGRAKVGEGAVGIQPGARYAAKQLPEEVLTEVARAMLAEGRNLVLLGGSEEAESAARLAEALEGRALNLTGGTTIRQTLGVLANLSLMVGSDTGVMHMAAGVGCPTVTVFGPTNPQKWGHAYPPHRVVAAPNGVMAEVPATEIVEAARSVLHAGRS